MGLGGPKTTVRGIDLCILIPQNGIKNIFYTARGILGPPIGPPHTMFLPFWGYLHASAPYMQCYLSAHTHPTA